MKKIFLLSDYRGKFYSSIKSRGAGVDTGILKEYFAKYNYELVVIPFSKIDFRNQSYKNQLVIYQSSEDPGLYYRSYIEDVVMGLYLQGAILIPGIGHFKAHHNKHFMEIFRDIVDIKEIKKIHSYRYGTYEDYLNDFNKITKEGAFVLKSSSTSKSNGVFLLQSISDKISLPRKISSTFSFKNLEYFFEKIRTGNKPLLISNNRNKFILQTYIGGLKGDYRVVVYGKKYYVLYRENRDNDFRASGSMKFNYDAPMPNGLLDFSKKVFEGFNVPYIAIDIGVKENDFFVFEFQFLSFGQYTLEKSNYFYSLKENKWVKTEEKPDLEREIVVSLVDYINTIK